MAAAKWGALREEIVSAVNNGVTSRELAEKYGTNLQTMSMVLSRFRSVGYLGPAKNSPTRLGANAQTTLRLAVVNGVPVAHVATELGLGKDVALRIVKKEGLKPKPRWTPLNWDQLDKEILYRRQELNQTGRQIAKALGISEKSVRLRLELFGLKGYIVRPPKPPKLKKLRVKKPKALKPKRQEPHFSIIVPEKTDGAALWNKAVALVSKRIGDLQARLDVTQNLCCAVVLGDIQESEMEKHLGKMIGSVIGSASEPGLLSLDASLQGGSSLHELIPSDF